MNSRICNLASEVHLSPTETLIHLQDFILQTKDISAITAPQGMEVWHNIQDAKIKLIITKGDSILPVDTLNIKYNDNSEESLVLIKSKKIQHVVRYYPQGYVSSVQIAGDFNSWNPKGYDFTYKNNCWEFTLEIEPGNYSYQLIVDGNWIKDPLNNEVLENGYGD